MTYNTQFTGLGDRLLDIIGFCVLCKFKNLQPNICWNKIIKTWAWGCNDYDKNLFKFKNITTNNIEYPNKFQEKINQSVTLSPYIIYLHLKNQDISLSDIITAFINSCNMIEPAEEVLLALPKNIEMAHGVHLRKSDKVAGSGPITVSQQEFQMINTHVIKYCKQIIDDEICPTFYICSEDEEYSTNFKKKLLNYATSINKAIDILEPNYATKKGSYMSVIDLFALSKCKLIIQNIAYSTFSLVAALLGSKKIINYAHLCQSYPTCLLHLWSPLLYINNSTTLTEINYSSLDKISRLFMLLK